MEAASIRFTPNCLRANMLALTLMSVGRIVCNFPCRGRNATDLPLISPMVIVSEGLPYGVSIFISWTFLRSLGS